MRDWSRKSRIVKKVWNRSDWSMIQIPKGTRNSLNKCKNWQRKGPSCEKKLYRWEKKRSQRSLWQSQKTKEDQQSWFRDCPFERHHINEKEKKTARINVDLNRSEARVMKTTLLTEGKVQWLLTFFCTNTPLSLKQSRYLMQKRMLTKSGTNWSTCQLGENLKKKVRGRLLSKHERKTVHFATFMDWCHLKKSALEDGFAGYTGRVVLRGDEVKDDSGSHAVVFHVTHDRSQSIGRHFQIAWLRWRSERRSICLHPCENGGRSRFIGIAKVRMSNSLGTSTTFSMSETMDKIQALVVPFERLAYGPPLAGLLWERQFDQFSLKENWKNVPQWEPPVHAPRKRLISLCTCGRQKIDRKEETLDTYVET